MKRGREECDGGNCLMLLTKVGESESKAIVSEGRDSIGDFKCKTCNRRFSSFQALGGHRASHRKPKLMVTDLWCHGHHNYLPSPTMKQSRMHPCPICGLEFAVGQALGGHMRKHRSAINDGLLCHNKPSLSFLNKSNDAERLNMCLDLNLTPLENDDLKLNLSMPVLKCFI